MDESSAIGLILSTMLSINFANKMDFKRLRQSGKLTWHVQVWGWRKKELTKDYWINITRLEWQSLDKTYFISSKSKHLKMDHQLKSKLAFIQGMSYQGWLGKTSLSFLSSGIQLIKRAEYALNAKRTRYLSVHKHKSY